MPSGPPVAYRCSRQVADDVGGEFEVELSEEEQRYLMMHVARLRDREHVG